MQGHNQFLVITIFLVVMLAIFHSGEALECYDCDSNNSKTCEVGTLSANEAIPCSGKCARYNQTLSGKNVIFRICSELKNNVCESLKKGSNDEIVKDCYECSDDLCNASATNAISTIIMITSGLITLLWTIH